MDKDSDIDNIINDIDKLPNEPFEKVKKKKVNGCRKGKASERDLCHELEEIFPGEIFRRVPGSGMFMGGFNFNRNMQINDGAKQTLTGDIITPTFFKFSIESKAYDDTPLFHKVLTGEDKDLDKWIKQASDDANKVDKKFLLIFKITSKRKAFICMNIIDFGEYSSSRNLKLPENYLIYKNKYIIFEKSVFFENYLKHYKKVNDWFFTTSL